MADELVRFLAALPRRLDNSLRRSRANARDCLRTVRPASGTRRGMGSTHFLTRTLEKVKTEMSLQVLAYNMKRMINIFGVNPLMQAIAA